MYYQLKSYVRTVLYDAIIQLQILVGGFIMGKRGEGWVAAQLFLFVVILLSPQFDAFSFPLWLRVLGFLILCGGGILSTLGLLNLGRNLTPFPKPIAGGRLVRSGAYNLVRHPIYTGLIFGTLGWALLTDTLLGLAFVMVIFIFFDLKSRREERWLTEAYPDYPEYQKRVKKLIPWIY